MNKLKLIIDYVNACQKHSDKQYSNIGRLYAIIRLSITANNERLLELTHKLNNKA